MNVTVNLPEKSPPEAGRWRRDRWDAASAGGTCPTGVGPGLGSREDTLGRLDTPGLACSWWALHGVSESHFPCLEQDAGALPVGGGAGLGGGARAVCPPPTPPPRALGSPCLPLSPQRGCVWPPLPSPHRVSAFMSLLVLPD